MDSKAVLQQRARTQAHLRSIIEQVAPSAGDASALLQRREHTRPLPASKAVLVRTYALPRQEPVEALQFDRFLLRYGGLDLERANPDLIWGVCGTESMGRANSYAALDAQRLQRRVYQIDLWYALSRPNVSTALTTEEVREHGFVPLKRLDSDCRAFLRSLFLERLEEERDPQLDMLKLETSVDALAAQRPMLVHWYMSVCPWVHAVQHTVYVGGGAALSVMTLRRNPARYLRVETRYHPEIVTTVESSASLGHAG